MENIAKNGIVGLPDEVFPVVMDNARPALELDEGPLTGQLRKVGSGLIARATGSNSGPSPEKLVSTYCSLAPLVRPVPLMAKNSVGT